MLNRSVCLLTSGGLDSALLLRQLQGGKKDIVPLYVRCGLFWEKAELYWLRQLLHKLQGKGISSLQILDLPLHSLYKDHWSMSGKGIPAAGSSDRAVYMPGRNLFLLSAGAILCAGRNIRTIAIGTLRNNPFGDASVTFLDSMSRCLGEALGYHIRISTPFIGMNKAQLIRRVSGFPVKLTFSCINPKGYLHCGRCNKCAERKRAFRQAGIPDPTGYA